VDGWKGGEGAPAGRQRVSGAGGGGPAWWWWLSASGV